MSNRRDLKKDINNLTFEVINECYSSLEYSPSYHFQDIMDIMQEAVDLRNDLIQKINHDNDGLIGVEKRKYFKQILDLLYDKNIELIDRLNEIDSASAEPA